MNILVLGAGSWGTTISVILAQKGYNVYLWGRDPEITELINYRENKTYLPGIIIPHNVNPSPTIPALDFSLVLSVIPVKFLRETLGKIVVQDNFIKIFGDGTGKLKIVSLSKGIEENTWQLPSQIIREVLNKANFRNFKIAVLSGPSIALEVIKNLPTTVVVASNDSEFAKFCQSTFFTNYLRVYTNDDIIGVEFAGAMKNVISIAMGICEGLGLGDNAKASLLTRGLVEMARLGVCLGAKRSTFFGISGLGDLITTSYSPFSRNHKVGVLLGKGYLLSDILKDMVQIAEGIYSVKAIVQIAEKYNVDIPISKVVFNILYGNLTPTEGVKLLLSRLPKSETDDLV